MRRLIAFSSETEFLTLWLSRASIASVGLQPVVRRRVNNWAYPLFPIPLLFLL